jgi:hypothetical protein
MEAPNPKQIPIAQIQNKIGLVIRNWNLVLIWNLEFVIWDFQILCALLYSCPDYGKTPKNSVSP